MQDSKVILQVAGLSKRFASGQNDCVVIDDITFSVNSGEIIILFGSSGSGKTTLLNLLAALDMPSSGDIIINGRNIAGLNDEQQSNFRSKDVGFVFQNYNLISFLTASDNIALPGFFFGGDVDEDFYQKVVSDLGISNLLSQYPNTLSGGQQQRVGIARAMVHRPIIVLADEPTGNLDNENSEKVGRLLVDLAREYNQTLIIATHDTRFRQYADRIFEMRNGKIIEEYLPSNPSIKGVPE